jgi:ATP-dependent exoDNAse (exonuclease V) beta subunit
LSGTIDLVFKDADGWRLVDYKTDAEVDSETLQAKYAQQLAAYEQAWGRFAEGIITSSILGARNPTLRS